jgi:hypothetical protein
MFKPCFLIMRNHTLFYALTGIDPQDKSFRPTVDLKPDTQSFLLLEKGHMMEYIPVEPGNKKLIALFFGPGETVIKCHPFSTMVTLDRAESSGLTYGHIIGTLHQFPESQLQYQELRKKYNEKVADRLRIQTITPHERFRHLYATQPWVFALVGREDIASYLGVTVGVLRKMML